MAIRVEDMGELAYGGLVTASKWWDTQRMADGKLTDKDILKKLSTYTYLIPGGAATIMSAFGTWRRYETWLEHISHGFMYDFPGWLVGVIQSMQGTAGGNAAVKEAQRILNQKMKTKTLTQGRASGAQARQNLGSWPFVPEEERGVVGQGHTVKDYA